MADGVRIDTWLWCVRVFKTRSASHEACRQGRVSINDSVIKPARRVKAGDQVEVRRRDRTIRHEVIEPVTKRVGADRVPSLLVDHSPPPEDQSDPRSELGGVRERGSGRPTKRERREIDRLQGR
ncbi:MAG: RNA-binding S4 domain-containing protein [Actinomycetia bacterium]|nr:RNA-binding S4 domain-containing protein [Actinomycetes bacterium]